MPKLLWVALPLLLAAALTATQALRRQPVFDWHFLFGYGTVLLVI
jgi:hypothetical protein